MSISFRTDWFDLAVQGTLGVGSHFLLQGIFPTQGSNLRLQHCRQLLYQLTQQGRAKPQNVCRLMVLTQSKTTRCLELWSISSTHYKKQPWKWHLIVQELILHWKIKIRSNLEGAIDGIWEEVPEHGFSMCLSHGEVFKAKNKCLKLKNTMTLKNFFYLSLIWHACVSFLNQVVKVLEFQLYYRSFQWTPRTYLLQDGLVGSPCSPRNSQESSPTPQFKSINTSALTFLYSLTLTSIHDDWKKHSFDLMDPCWEIYAVYVGHNFSSKE